MAILSKEIFDRNVFDETPCSVLHLWSSSCIDGVSVVAFNVFIGCVKFFGPIYMLKLLLNWKKSDNNDVLNQLIAYIRSIVYGMTFGTMLFGSICLLTKIFRLRYYHVATAGFVSGLSILVESQENKTLDTLLFFNQAIECFVNMLTNTTNGERPRRSRLGETLSFMLVSSILMYLFKTHTVPVSFTHLWFYPTRSIFENPKQPSPTACTHKGSCLEYSCQSAAKYFFMGYLLEFVKNTLPKLGRLISHRKILFRTLFNRRNVLFGSFFGGYAFLYRWITCYLRRKDGEERPVHSMVAGFFAAVAYCLKPNLQLPIIGFATILQLLWQRVCLKYRMPKLPYDVIIFIVSTGILIHFRFLLHDYCPKYTRNMLNMVTNNLDARVYNTLWNILEVTDEVLIKRRLESR